MKLELKVLGIKQEIGGEESFHPDTPLEVQTGDNGLEFFFGDDGFQIPYQDLWLLTQMGDRALNEINRKRYEAQTSSQLGRGAIAFSPVI